MNLPYSLRKNLARQNLARVSAWRDRAVVWLSAATAGFVVVCFTWLSDAAMTLFNHARAASPWWPFLLGPAVGVGVAWITRYCAPTSAGSGIPQVMTAISPNLPRAAVGHFISLRVAVAKMLLGASVLVAGFSTGREGPSVQISASVMNAFRHLLGRASHVRQEDLILAGGAAGIAAAFNAPLAGVVFAIEELSRRFEQRASGVVVSAIVLAGVVAVSLEGNYTYFGRLHVPELGSALLVPASVCALAAGLLGGLFSRLLIESSNGVRGRIQAFRREHPAIFGGLCGLGIALVGFASAGAAHGSGYAYTREMLAGERQLPVLYVLFKFIATWLSYWSGVPGGIFAPSLAIGAGLGNDIALLFHTAAIPLAAIGMVGFLAAATQAPITAFIIVMEMIDGHGMVLSLMATALAASLVSRLLSPGLYGTLSRAQIEGWNAR